MKIPKSAAFAFAAASFAACLSIVPMMFHAADSCLRTGERLSDEKKIELAVSAVLSSYPPAVVKKIWVERSEGRVEEEPAAGDHPQAYSLHQPDRTVFYSGTKDFFEKNKACCTVVSERSLEEGAPSRWSMLLGGEVSYVRVTYQVRYLDERGNVVAQTYQEFVGITGCGKAVRSAGKIL